MRDLIRVSSATLTIIAGAVLLILWLLAANDKGPGSYGNRKCRGVSELFHEAMADGDFQTTLIDQSFTPFSNSLNAWVKNNREAYPLLVAFGVIVGVFWMVTGAIGFVARSGIMAKLYLLFGVASYATFVVIFPIIVERYQFMTDNPIYSKYLWNTKGGCRQDKDWILKHTYDSFEEFWGASLAGFLLGAYQIAAAIFLCATSDNVPAASSVQK